MLNLINDDCLVYMNTLPENHIDLTVTSPPYDNLRTYNGNNSDWNSDKWKAVISELYRVTKEGGVVVWIVGDATINGSETGTSFKQALYAIDVGFNLHDTMIYKKLGGARGSNLCYWQRFEYMFILSKGRPKTLNLICDRKNITAGKNGSASNGYAANGNRKVNKKVNNVAEFSKRENVWNVCAGNNTGDDKNSHPAVFPESLAEDHINSWSNKHDLVFDPFMGSGTTGKMANKLNRNFIGVELDKEYFKIAQNRCSNGLMDMAIHE